MKFSQSMGKSELALRLCEALDGEIISVDSVQVYRHLKIGANKPSPSELARVPLPTLPGDAAPAIARTLTAGSRG